MKKVIVFCVCIFFIISFIHAENVTLTYPANVHAGEAFEIEVDLLNFSDGARDLKFEIMNGSKHIAKRFWENSWRSTHYWMNEAFTTGEEDKKFKVMINEEYAGTSEIIIKLREGKKISLFGGNVIHIEANEKSNEEKTDSEKNRIKIDWNKNEVINDDVFVIELKGLPTETYDIRVWITSNGKIISERYDPSADEWKSGMFYINALEGEKQPITVRLEESNRNFSGKAQLIVKLRNGEETKEDIIILSSEHEEKTVENVTSASLFQQKNNSSEETIIRLDKTISGNAIATEAGEVVYESKNEKMKRIALFGFAFVCVAICLLVLWKK